MHQPKPVVLEGAHIRLEPLTITHLPDLTVAGDEDPSIFQFMVSNPYQRRGWKSWLAEALDGPEKGRYVCWAMVERRTGELIGSTRFGDIQPEHERLEIGWSWLVPSRQGTGLNAEAKLLQLRYAFDALGVGRVAFRTHARNERAQVALEHIGAVREGVLRRDTRMSDGGFRDTVVYSILIEEWPAVQLRLEARLGT